MDDYKIFIYIILAIIYFVGFGKKKKKRAMPKPSPTNASGSKRQNPKSTSPINKPKPTFEDLLKEFTGEKVTEEVVQASKMEKPEPKRVKPNVVFEEEARSLELINKEGEGLTRPTFAKFSNYDKEVDDGFEDVKSSLFDTDGAQKAIILSEILNRKY